MHLNRSPVRLTAVVAAALLTLTMSACGDDNNSSGTVTNLSTDSPSGSDEGSGSGSGSGSSSASVADEPSASATPLTADEQKAVDAYRTYVKEQVDDTVATSKDLVAALKAGDVSKAKELYPKSRIGWERIEPVAEAFGDLDPKLDRREADLESGDTWTGWHVIEKQLWVSKNTDGMDKVGDQLLADLDTLAKQIPNAEITPTTMANGAKELLDEVASGKITGEEEAFSHTDLVDFKGNVDGAKKVFELLKPLVDDADLVKTLETEFADVETALQKYEKGDTYVSYDTVTDAQRRELTDVVNALAEPLSKLAGAVQ